MADFANDSDMLGSDLAGYAKAVVSEVVGLGRGGTLVDWEGGGATSHLAENRASATYYRAEQIINWRVERVRGRNVPTPCASQPSTINGQPSTKTTYTKFFTKPLGLTGTAEAPI